MLGLGALSRLVSLWHDGLERSLGRQPDLWSYSIGCKYRLDSRILDRDLCLASRTTSMTKY